MSHFSVWVVAKEYDDLERILAPYKQLGWGEDDQPLIDAGWLKVEEVVEYPRSEFETECRKIIGTLAERNTRKEVPDFEIVARYDALYVDKKYDEIMTDYHGGKLTNDGLVYVHNPRGEKWDWWTIDGRYGTVDKSGERVGYALVSDMDFAALKQRERKRNEDNLATVRECLAVAGHTFESFQKLELDEKRAVSRVVQTNIGDVDKYLTFAFFDFNGATEQEHLENCDIVPCWAFIDQDGEWHEKSEMGMFGMHGDEHTQAHEFESAFDAWVAKLNPEDTLFVVDCHI